MKEMSLYQKVIHCNKYAKYLPEKNRREYWSESVDRFVNYLMKKTERSYLINPKKYNDMFIDINHAVLNQKVMPSMRLFFSAGIAIEKENQMAFNCKFQSMNTLKAFADLLYSLMCTCGVGCSVQKQYINQLPQIPKHLIYSQDMIVVEDSREGWAKAFLQFLEKIFNDGKVYFFDVSKIRKKGAKLKSSGGTASGSIPLLELRQFIDTLVNNHKGEQLKSTQVFDIICKIAGCVVAGGLRRSAIITLFDEDDDEMFHIKDPEKIKNNTHRYNSNNTVVCTKDETIFKVLEVAKFNGEPGLMFKNNVDRKMKELGRTLTRGDWGLNPCAEIILRPNQMCNLSEVILRPDDTFEDDLEKVKIATIIGLIQGTLTNFKFIDEECKNNQEDESLLGVSLTGIADCPRYADMSNEKIKRLKETAILTSEYYWEFIGLKNKPKSITTIKPSGTVSLLVDSSSGIHARYAPYYIKRTIIGKESELYQFLTDNNIPYIDVESVNGRIFEFPLKAPKESKVVKDLTLENQLEIVENSMKNWCSHNTSATIYVQENEWDKFGKRLSDSKEFLALSFLPLDINQDTSGFAYLPLEEITEEEYLRRKKIENMVDWKDISKYYIMEIDENEDQKRDFACMGGACELI